MSLVVITPPTAEPVSVPEARAQVKMDLTDDDAALALYLIAAREMAEHELQRALVARTYELTLDAFPDGTIEIPMGPVAAAGGTLTVSSIKYTDLTGAEITIDPSAYTVDGISDAPRIVATSGWPTTKDTVNAVRVRFVSGSADPSLIPAGVKAWILAHVAEMYARREANVTTTAISPLPRLGRLLDPYRSYR